MKDSMMKTSRNEIDNDLLLQESIEKTECFLLQKSIKRVKNELKKIKVVNS